MGQLQPSRLERRAEAGSALALSLLLLVSAGCGRPPTTPGPIVPGLANLDISCPTSLLVGQLRFCFANAHYTDGSTRVEAASWSSSNPNIASIALVGNAAGLTGRGAGQVTVSSEFGGKLATALVSVSAEDFLTLEATGIQGTFQVGRIVTMDGIGRYGVATADAGELNIEITDQDGKLVAAGIPRIVLKGGDSFTLASTFTIPSGTTKVCRTIILQIGSVRLTAVGSAGLFPCIDVVP